MNVSDTAFTSNRYHRGKERLKGKPDAALSSSPEWANRQGRPTKTWNSLCVYGKSQA